MTRVHLTRRVAGPAGNWPAGTTVEVADTMARELVAAGAAELIDDMPAYVPAPEVKTASKGKGPKRETATAPGIEDRETATEK